MMAGWHHVSEGLPPYVEGEQWWVWGPSFTGVFIAERSDSVMYAWNNGDTWFDVDRGVTHYQRAEAPPPPGEGKPGPPYRGQR